MVTTIDTTIIGRDLFIDGQWKPAVNGRHVDKFSPVTGERVGRFALASAADAKKAVQAARTASVTTLPPCRTCS